MSAPKKRIRLNFQPEASDLTDSQESITQSALNKFTELSTDSQHSDSNGETKKPARKPAATKAIPIRATPLDEPAEIKASMKFRCEKDTLVNLIFDRPDVSDQDISQRYEAAIYEYSNGRKLKFFPIAFNSKSATSYTCGDCYRMFAIMTAIRSRLDNPHCCKFEELNAKTDPLAFPHYCAHADTLAPAQHKYFGEYAWHFNNNDRGDNILDFAYAIGRFTKKLCSMDEKLTKFCVDNEGTDPSVLTTYVMRLDYTVSDQKHAESFLKSFKQLHKDEIKYDNDLLFFESSADSQDSGFSDSPVSVTSQSTRSHKRKLPASQSTQSLQQPSSATKSKSSKTRVLQRASTASARVQKYAAVPPKGTAVVSPTQQVKTFESDLDVSQFLAGLILNAMNTVTNAQLQVLFNELRPLVTKYAPNYLNQFITMIHVIDRQMPSRLRSVDLNIQSGNTTDWRTANDTQSQLPISPTSAFRSRPQKPTVGTSTNPIVVPDDPTDEKVLLQNAVVKQEK